MRYQRQIRANIVAELSRRDISQSQAAEIMGLKQAGLSSRLRGRIEFRVSELLAMGELLNIDIEILLAGVQQFYREETERVVA